MFQDIQHIPLFHDQDPDNTVFPVQDDQYFKIILLITWYI